MVMDTVEPVLTPFKAVLTSEPYSCPFTTTGLPEDCLCGNEW